MALFLQPSALREHTQATMRLLRKECFYQRQHDLDVKRYQNNKKETNK